MESKWELKRESRRSGWALWKLPYQPRKLLPQPVPERLFLINWSSPEALLGLRLSWPSLPLGNMFLWPGAGFWLGLCSNLSSRALLCPPS